MSIRLSKYKDEKETDSVKRFFGDIFAVRIALSVAQTVSSTVNLPTLLSPWGDNNSVTLPNVRRRDVIMLTASLVGGSLLIEGCGDALSDIIDSEFFTAEVINPNVDYLTENIVSKIVLFQILEQAIDKTFIEHIFPDEEKVLYTTSMCTLQCVIKHKLINNNADIELFDVKPTKNPLSYEKGWFCPYLYASARTPNIPRSKDFSIAQCFGPILRADYSLAHKLLSECATVLPLCESNPEVDIGCSRLLMVFVGITPYRLDMWSSSRRPGAAMMNFHLLNGCPGIVVPVNTKAPLVAWSSVNLSMMQSDRYNALEHHRKLCTFLDSIVSRSRFFAPEVMNNSRAAVRRGVSMVINGAIMTKDVAPIILKGLDPERAGIVFFRY